ncbi:MAG TPA: branched-chain amino acid ABC transporter permease, partial [Methylomirabilota bacterium]|nr:branched-chain amino acid ABC transporter permease [Methylomirabilota bacterium]
MSAGALTPVQAGRAAARRERWRAPTLYLRLAVVLAWVLLPTVGPSFQVLDLAVKIALFGTLAAS